jgi:WD40 repeat protein
MNQMTILGWSLCISAIALFSTTNRQITGATTTQQTCTPPNDPVNLIELSPDGKHVLSSWGTGISALWDLSMGTLIHKFDDKTFSSVTSLQFSPDGTQILTGSKYQATLWDVGTGQKLKTFVQDKALISGNNIIGIKARFTPDGKGILTATDNGIALWNKVSGEMIRYFQGEFAPFNIDFDWLSPDGNYVLTFKTLSLEEQRMDWVIWDVQSGKQLHELKNYLFVNFLSKPNTIVTVAENGLDIWDLIPFKQRFSFHSDERFGKFQVNSSGNYFAVTILEADSSDAREIEFWNTETQKKIGTIPLTKESTWTIKFIPDTHYFIFVEPTPQGRELSLWDLQTMKEIKRVSFDELVYQFLFLPDKFQLLVGANDYTLHLWDLNIGQLLKKLC